MARDSELLYLDSYKYLKVFHFRSYVERKVDQDSRHPSHLVGLYPGYVVGVFMTQFQYQTSGADAVRGGRERLTGLQC